MLRLTGILVLALSLAACGGGSGGNPQQTGPTAQDLANAKAASVTGSLDLSTHMATLNWVDTFSNTTGYRIEQQATDGTWSQIDSIPGQGGSQHPLSWSGAVNVSTTLRIEAALTNYSVPLDSPSGQQSVQLAVPATTPAIVLNQPQPVSGSVGVSIGGGGTYSGVDYFVDLNAFASSSTGPTYAVTLDSSQLTTGSHLLLAHLHTGPDTYLEIRLTAQVTTSAVAVQIQTQGTAAPNGLYGTVDIDVLATSDNGIQSVTAALDGKSLGSLTAPNACVLCLGTNNAYQFTVDTKAVGSGKHTITAQATDNANGTASATSTVTFDNPPVLTLTSPIDGALVNGTLHVAGTFSTDKSGGVTLSATLGSVPVLNTTSSPFATDYTLANVNPGSYTLTVNATDSQGDVTTSTAIVTVTSSAALVYSPLLIAGQFGGLLAAENTTLAYSLSIPNVSGATAHLRSGAADVVLQNAPGNTGNRWVVSNGYVFSNDSSGNVYMWSPAGTQTNLSTLAQTPGAPKPAGLQAAHWPWVLMGGQAATCGQAYSNMNNVYCEIFYNASTSQPPVLVLAPSGYTGAVEGDFYLSQANGLQLYYFGEISANQSSILLWNQATNQSTVVASNVVLSGSTIQTDGTLVAWATGSTPPLTLAAQNIATAAQQTLSNILYSRFGVSYQEADGLVAWAESASNGGAVKVFNGTNITTVSTKTSSYLFGTGGGYVLFEEDSKMYAWNVATQARQLLFEATPGQALISGKTVYFTNGLQQAVYTVTLP